MIGPREETLLCGGHALQRGPLAELDWAAIDPLAVWRHLDLHGFPDAVLLDASRSMRAAGSVQDGNLARYSFVGWNVIESVRVADVDCEGAFVGLASLAALERRWRAPGITSDRAQPFAFLAIAYEFGRALEQVPPAKQCVRTSSDLIARVFSHFLRWDHLTGEVALLSWNSAHALASLADLQPLEPLRPANHLPSSPPQLHSALGEAAHRNAVERARDYLRAGDAYQVNCTDRWRVALPADDTALDVATLFRDIRDAAEVPFAALWRDGAAVTLSASPELFLRTYRSNQQLWIETRPIKGTRRSANSSDFDRAALASDPKEQSEHLMIVDLERNDLGRICEVGSVQVEQFARTIALPGLLHLVSTVRGRLRPAENIETILRATFPCGSITGAPKRRAMQLISELEPESRGIYTGAIGWLGDGGELTLSIAIRTAVLCGNELTFGVGGGIVIDSEPAREWDELHVKAQAFARAMTASLRGV